MVASLSSTRRAFTLVELLVVIGIIGLLVGILLPSLSRANSQARAVKCLSNLRQIGMGLVEYSTENHGLVVPGYNLPAAAGSSTNYTAGPLQPMDGWCAILDRDGMVACPAAGSRTNTPFYCPDTVDIEGVKDGQTGTSGSKPRGWTDWPMMFPVAGGDSGEKVAVTMPDQGFNKIIRCSYWINAYNPIGSAVGNLPAADLYYTSSVGFGPDNNGEYLRQHNTSSITHSSQFIVLADGVYMGRQSSTQLGQSNSRIGYRHPGLGTNNGSANVCFADGHCEAIDGKSFPQALSSSDSAATQAKKMSNQTAGACIYAAPEQVDQANGIH